MKTPREKLGCDPGRIEVWLKGGLSPDEQRQFESHLDDCTICRCRLETAAAEPTYWQEAAVHLQDDALDDGLSEWTGRSDSDSVGADAGNYASRIIDYFDPTDDPRMLGRFGGYEIVGIVGCGGMSVVLKGFEGALDRYIAIKLLAPHLATSGAARRDLPGKPARQPQCFTRMSCRYTASPRPRGCRSWLCPICRESRSKSAWTSMDRCS